MGEASERMNTLPMSVGASPSENVRRKYRLLLDSPVVPDAEFAFAIDGLNFES
jgi:hypothetical protein